MRFQIRIDPLWRPTLILAGATDQNSYVFLGDDALHFRLGLLFNRTVPYDLVAAVFPRSWPLLYGIGVRPNLRGVIGLTGSYHDVVEVRLARRIANWAALFPVDRICVSLEEPENFIAELTHRARLAEPPDISALAKPRRKPTPRVGATLGAVPGGTGEARPGKGGATARTPRPHTPKPTSTSTKNTGSKANATRKPRSQARAEGPARDATSNRTKAEPHKPPPPDRTALRD